MKNVDDVVRETVESFVRAGELFTALDVSNKVKESLPLARHREVRDVVRGLYGSDMVNAGYARTPITVTLADGTTTDALLYHPLADSWDLDAKYDTQQRARVAARPGAVVQPVVSTPAVTIPAPPPAVANTAVTIPAPAGNARAMWDALFQSQPSLFPRR